MAFRFTRLDRRAIRALRPGETITEHGIRAERLADGDIRYTVNIMVDGTRVHRLVGRESAGTTRSQAEEYIAQVRTDTKHGRLDLPQARKVHLTFARAADDYFKGLEETGGKNVGIKLRQLILHLKPFFGFQRLGAVTAFTVDRYK